MMQFLSDAFRRGVAVSSPVFSYKLLILCSLFIGILSLSAQDELPLYDLPNSVNYQAFSSNSLVALSGGRMVTANMLTNSVTLVDVRLNEVIAEISVGDDPRSIDVTPDGTRLLVTNRGDDSLSVIDIENQSVVANHHVGESPYAVITDNNTTAYVSLQGADAVIEIDLVTGRIVQDIPTPSNPTGLALWGDFLYITHFHTGQISLIYLPVGDVVRTISTGQNSGLSPFITVDSRNGLAYIPQSVTYPDSANPTFDRTIRPRVIVIDLSQMRVLRDRTLWLDIADQPVNMPFSIALNVAQGRLFVLNAGSNDLSVIDLNTGLALWNTPLPDNPRGLVLTSDSTTLYVNNAVDSSLSLLETRFYSVKDTIPMSTNSPDLTIRLGAELFHRATDERVSGTSYLSCASCHFDGESDERNWFGVNTPTFGNMPNDFDLNTHIATVTYGAGFDEGDDFEAEALIAYMQSLNND
jgi:YVTN family beta-propeller protein